MNGYTVNGPGCRQNKREVFYVTPYPHNSIYKSQDKIFTDEYKQQYVTVGQVGWDGLVKSLEQARQHNL
jgi:hypothetical protein